MRDAWKGEIPLSPMVPGPPANDLFEIGATTLGLGHTHMAQSYA
jgi:hypothetical protein